MENDHLLLDIAGVRPIFVDALGRDAVLYLEDGWVLIDSGLCPESVESIVDQVLARAAAALVA